MHPLLRYTVDLFEDALTPAAPLAAPRPGEDLPRRVLRSRPIRPAPGEVVAQDAMNAIANGEAHQPVGTGAKPYHHPKANRKMQLKQVEVAYLYQKARRRTIGFSVGVDGLVVRAPQWVSLADVDAALLVKGDWILRKLAVSQERELRQQQGALQWVHGAVVPYLGEPMQLVLDPTHSGAAQWIAASGGSEMAVSLAQLRIGLPQTAEPAQVRDAVQAWLMRQARELFTKCLDRYAVQLGVQWTKLTLTSAGTRWGSARTDGAIRLNWRLIHFRQPIIDYVVAHELSHLRVMDHSPRFWDTVRSIVPDYAAMRKDLREDGGPRWD